MAAPHGDAGDDPYRELVDLRCCAGCGDTRKVEARPDGDPPHRLAAAIRDEAGCVPPAGEPRHDRAAPLLRIHTDVTEDALVLGGVARVEVPACRAPRPGGSDP